MPQQRRTAHEHQRQLHGRILLAAAAPDADQEVHRNQRHLVEHEHREEVDRDEESEDADAQQTEPQEIGLYVLLHLPRGKGARKDDDGREQQHGHRDAVDTHGVVDMERGVPHDAVGQQHLSRFTRLAQSEVVEDEPDGQRQQHRRSRHHHGMDLPPRLREPQPQHHQEGHGRKQG